ncbi:PREDICTED: lymphocyte-specific protein 1 isoform X1 [Crocodylus porosus]|uniref:lymphocyte-specific protein 1 isoform X1 n=1 Tax=Crocodylus porosus TaxID=8502 RepID=UPI00093FCFFB|nr:PREDICTED: lymphocyte-specific protein 1 isoform X1 [Crocodylus porosus]
MSDSEECQGGPEGEDQVGEEPLTEPERMTTQWSVEDEEEAARERRRREREKQLRSQAEETLNNTSSCSENEVPSEENQCDFKPSGTSELEEDEGFSDWSQKLEQRKQRSPRQSYEEEDSGLREAEVKMEQVQLDQESPEEVNQEENEELKQKQLETEEYGQLCEEEHGQEQQQQQEEEEEQQLQEDKKRRRNEEEDTPEKRPKAPSPCNFEEDEECSGQSPPSSTKITDRTESLNRSIQKSNSIKKTQPPLPVSKIDDRLEQYTHAIETSAKTPKPVRQPSIDLPAAMVVASTKSLWETGEVAAQASPKTPACKDIVAGDIVSKRSLWEQKGGPKLEGNAKSTPGKKYKFVSTGHGQYKKVLIDDATEQ